jgi:3-methyladenine DNA glycosylase/8-oxoguanine DNA glycosylase
VVFAHRIFAVGGYNFQDMMRLSCVVFNFSRLVQSHGWRYLAPFEWDAENQLLKRPLYLQDARTIKVALRCVLTPRAARIEVRPLDVASIPVGERGGLRLQIRRMLCLDEDFDDFHAVCKTDPLLQFAHHEKCGGMLRSPTAFEDVVKTVCTTNCDWRNTKLMCEQLCVLGGGNFPTPAQILAIKERTLKAKTALGYRTRSVREIALEVSQGRLPLDEWAAGGQFDLAREKLKSIWGIGQYSVNHILILLGDYRHIPVDSEVLRYLRKTHFGSRNVTENQAVSPYSRFGNYRYLAFKFGRIARAMNYVNK